MLCSCLVCSGLLYSTESAHSDSSRMMPRAPCLYPPNMRACWGVSASARLRLQQQLTFKWWYSSYSLCRWS